MPIVKIKLSSAEMSSVERSAYRVLLSSENAGGVEQFGDVSDVYRLALSLGLDALSLERRGETNAVRLTPLVKTNGPQTPALELAPAELKPQAVVMNLQTVPNFDLTREFMDTDSNDPLPSIENILAEKKPTEPMELAVPIETKPISLESQTPAYAQLAVDESQHVDALCASMRKSITAEVARVNYLKTRISRPDNSVFEDEKLISVPMQYEVSSRGVQEWPYEFGDRDLAPDPSWRQVLRQSLSADELPRHDYYAEFGMRRWHFTFESSNGDTKTLVFYWSPNPETWADRYDVPVPAFRNDRDIQIGYASADDAASDLATDEAETTVAARRYAHRIALVDGDPTPESAVKARFKPSRLKTPVKRLTEGEIMEMTLSQAPK